MQSWIYLKKKTEQLTTGTDKALASWLFLKHRQGTPASGPLNVLLPLSGVLLLPVTTYSDLLLYFFRCLAKCHLY